MEAADLQTRAGRGGGGPAAVEIGGVRAETTERGRKTSTSSGNHRAENR
jgi:hypothetical protein